MKILDHGFVELLDHMGSDAAVCDAARVSYASAEKRSNDRNLLRYLMRHRHTSPFEMCVVKFHVKAPIFVARQWVRHRMASWNEISGRYSELKSEFEEPETWRMQGILNKQGSGPETIELDSEYPEETTNKCLDTYRRLLGCGVSREQARIVLPLATYTEWVWKIDLHNLMHFLKLRMDEHAQEEIRVYARAIHDMVVPLFPETMAAFSDYVLDSLTLTRLEVEALREGRPLSVSCSDREFTEFEAKRSRLGLPALRFEDKIGHENLVRLGVKFVWCGDKRYDVMNVDKVERDTVWLVLGAYPSRVEKEVYDKDRHVHYWPYDHGVIRLVTGDGREVVRR